MGRLIIKFKNNSYSKDKDIKNAVRYVTGRKKGKSAEYWNVRGCRKNSPEKDIVYMQQVIGKNEGVRLKHLIVSLPDTFSMEDWAVIKIIADSLADYFFREYQVVYAVHTDTESVHYHFLINTVNLQTGKKWHNSRKELEIIKAKITGVVNGTLKEVGYPEHSL